MKYVIQSEKDANKLQGKFILQVNSNEPDKTLMDMSWGFAKEKRLKIITNLGYTTLYGDTKNFESFEKFKNWFNEYLFEHNIKEGKETGGRFHRLLSNEEFEYLFQKLKEENKV